jgi:hypothetical protein
MESERPSVRLLSSILWPAFLMACATEALVFAMVDPGDLHGLDGDALALSRQAVYSLGFLSFWALGAAACGLAVHLTKVPPEDAAGEIDDRFGA